jgi:threonyl-tRNA synthetase
MVKYLAEKIFIKFIDGTEQEFPKGMTLAEIITLQGKTDQKYIAGKVNGEMRDLSYPISESAEVEFIRLDSEKGLEILRHSTSHIMAQAVQEVFKGAKVAIGPAIENGFYYDFDYTRPFTVEDLETIENKMQEVIDRDYPFVRDESDRETAIKFFQDRNEGYKVDILRELSEGTVSLYRDGDFVDLCRGPHLPSTGWVKAFKLTGVAGAYWRGDERNKMLQRIYGTAFPTPKELEEHLNRLEKTGSPKTGKRA